LEITWVGIKSTGAVSVQRGAAMSHIPDDKPLTAGDLREILQERSRLLKNGETWGEYLGKWITPQNLVLVVMAGFTIGGRVQQAQTDITKALDSNARLVGEIATLSKAVDTQQKAVDAQQEAIEAQREMFATRQNLESLQERVRLNVTRREFREAIELQIVPRLDRIEKASR
jgi:hypothetical protein